jgi:hypothetical protein
MTDTLQAVDQLLNLAEHYMLDEDLQPIRAALAHIREPGHMLTADRVLEIVQYTGADVTELIQVTHPGHLLTTVRFLGINSVSQFVFAADRINSQTDIRGHGQGVRVLFKWCRDCSLLEVDTVGDWCYNACLLRGANHDHNSSRHAEP